MAGRGRGRGRGQMTFNLEDLGIGRGDSLPPTTFKPSPLFPPMPVQPVPLQTGEEVEYMLALKQELRAANKTLPFYIRRAAPKRDVDRYSDKYQSGEPKDSAIEWSPGHPPQIKQLKKPLVGKEEILTKLETLEKKEEAVNSEEEEDGEKKKTNEEEEQAEEEDYEEDFEEDTDYIMSYFDNGEEFGGDSDDNMDEATY
uniref:DNA-directed RNA polymerase III subunit n=1 Tax=Hucho hucho TaxID=62062 RepID=A0A4W5MH29_9TELE